MAQQQKRTVEEWAQMIMIAGLSGQTDAAWRKENGVPASTFSRWRQRLSPSPASDPVWIKASLPDEQPKPLTVAIGAFRIELCEGFSEELLERAAKALLRIC